MKAEIAWRHLNGLLCIYKPADMTVRQIRQTIITHLCRDLNELEVRPPINHVSFIENESQDITVKVHPSYADDVLVVGPRCQPEDMKIHFPAPLGARSSGVMVGGVNDGSSKMHILHVNNPMRVFHVKACMGQATDNSYKDGKVLFKANYDHVRRSIVDKVLAAFQAAHQKQMYLQIGVDIKTQAAYDLAVKGVIRPEKSTIPVVYSLKCVHFEPPDLTIEMHAINTNEEYLWLLIREIGRRLRTLAICTGVRCIKHGPFTTDNALLRKHWTLEHIRKNILLHKTIEEELTTTERDLYLKQDSNAVQQ